MKTKKKNKIKMFVAIYLAVVFILSAVAIIGTSAVTNTWEHEVEVGTSSGSYYTDGVTLHGNGSMSDTIFGYPYVFGGYSTSENRARATNSRTNVSTAWKSFTLYGDSGHVVMITYGTNLTSDFYVLRYEHVSNGGFRETLLWSESY